MRLTIAVVLICVIASACQFSESLHQTVARADETVVITTLRSISTAQNAYALSNGGNYGTFAQLVAGGFLDPRFDSEKPPVKDYSLAMVVKPKSDSASEGSFTVNADPQQEGAGRHYYIDSTSADIHVNATKPATATDEVLH